MELQPGNFTLWKSGQRKIMAVSEFGGLWRGDITRFYCNLSLTGMGKELENLILENTELLATK